MPPESPLASHRLSLLVEQIDAAVLVEDEHRMLAVVNVRFCDWFGVPVAPADLRGADCAAAAVQSAGLFSDPEAFLAGIEAVLGAAVPVAGERLRLRDGRVLERDYVPIWEDDAYRGHMWVYRDVSRTAAAEDAVRASRDALRDLVLVMRHEAASPIMAMDAAIGLLSTTALDPAQREAMHTLSVAMLALRHALGEALGRVGAAAELDDPVAASVRIDPLTVAQEAVTLCQPLAASQDLELGLDTAGLLHRRVIGDPDLLRQIVINLLQNAIKYTHEGSVTLRVRSTRVDAGPARLSFEVRDTGPGIPPDTTENLFQPYWRGAATDGVPGKGLGLALCRRLARAMGGEVALIESSMAGSTFGATFSLPVLDEPDAERLDGARILLVDDDPSVRQLYHHLLERAGARCEACGSTAAAFERLSRGPSLDLVVLDYHLGDETAVAALQMLSGEAPRPGVVLVTGHPRPRSLPGVTRESVDAIVPKPSRVAELVRVLARLWATRRPGPG